jgi:hypothetical protein
LITAPIVGFTLTQSLHGKARHFRSTPINGHRQTGQTGPGSCPETDITRGSPAGKNNQRNPGHRLARLTHPGIGDGVLSQAAVDSRGD